MGRLRILGRLQSAAVVADGEVVRLVGNHELNLAAGSVRARSAMRDPARLSARLREEMAAGKLVAAAAFEGMLFIHGGFTAESLGLVQRWVGEQRGSPGTVAAAVNRMLTVAARIARFGGGPFAGEGAGS